MTIEWVKFTDLLSTIVDNRGKTCPVQSSGLPLIATNCINGVDLYPDYSTTRFVSEDTYKTWFRGHPKAGDILFVCKGSPGRTNWVPDPVDFCIAQDMVSVRANPELVYPKYLFAALRSSIVQSQIQNMHVGTMIPHFKKGDFDKLKIPLLSKDAQIKVGDLYFDISERISVLKKNSETLEAIALATFKSWFINFDISELNEESDLPNGWHLSTVDKVFTLTMGQSPPGDTYNNEGNGIPFYQGRTDFGFRFPTLRMHCSAPTRFAEIGDTLVSVRAPVGDVNMAIERCCIGRGLASLRHTKYKSFAFYTARNLEAHFKNFDGEGTIFGSINKKAFQELPVVVPSEKELDAFEAIAQPIDSKIVSNEMQIRTLVELRDALLPRLMTGQLNIAADLKEMTT